MEMKMHLHLQKQYHPINKTNQNDLNEHSSEQACILPVSSERKHFSASVKVQMPLLSFEKRINVVKCRTKKYFQNNCNL